MYFFFFETPSVCFFFLKHPECVFFFLEPQGVCFEIHILFPNLVIETSSAPREPPRDKKNIYFFLFFFFSIFFLIFYFFSFAPFQVFPPPHSPSKQAKSPTSVSSSMKTHYVTLSPSKLGWNMEQQI